MEELKLPEKGTQEILEATDNIPFHTVLDCGFGNGAASLRFAKAGKKVTALGKNTEGAYPEEEFKKYGIQVYDQYFSEFAGGKYDAIWCSHMVEHSANVSQTLQKLRDMLNEDGWLFVIVPPYKSTIVSGHIATGWNLVELMLVLYFNGFNVKNGHFCSHRYNVCAFVKKNPTPRFKPEDGGLVEFPEIKADFPINLKQGIEGDIPAVNWFFDVVHDKWTIPRSHVKNNLAVMESQLAQMEKALQDAKAMMITNPELW